MTDPAAQPESAAERRRRGLAKMSEVYGWEFSDGPGAYFAVTADHVFADIWSRPGLSRHTRSLVTLAMTIALNRDEEFLLHLRGAINNGVTKEEIRELLIHSSVYCGVPAANHAFKLASDFFASNS